MSFNAVLVLTLMLCGVAAALGFWLRRRDHRSLGDQRGPSASTQRTPAKAVSGRRANRRA